MHRTENANPTEAEARLARLESQLDRVLHHLEAMEQRQRRLDDLVEVGIPIARQATGVVGGHLQALDDQGYVSLATAMKGGMDRVLSSYTAEDFELLAQNLVGILDVVRSLTQPEVLAIADEAAQAIRDAGSAKPVGMMAALRASSEEDVQRGMAVALQILRQVGHAAKGQRPGLARKTRRGPAAGMDPRLASRLAPSRPPAAEPVQEVSSSKSAEASTSKSAAAPSSKRAAAPASSSPAPAEASAVEGEGGEWSRELALAIAAAEGVELTPVAWSIIDYARKTYQESGSSPNIRALTRGMGIDTREVYACFPKAPGRTLARIAGIPKPAGCL